MGRPLLLLMIVGMTSGARASDWVEVPLPPGMTQRIYLETTSISKSWLGGPTEAWMKTVYLPPRQMGSAIVAMSTARFKLFCSEHKAQLIKVVSYAANGKTLDDSTSTDPPEQVVPDSAGDHFLTFTCKRINR